MDMIRPVARVRSRVSAASRRAALSRTLTRLPSRREVLRGLAATGVGLAFARRKELAEARKRHKRKRKKKDKKPRPNAFGCLDVGDACKSAEQCCSGVCEGKKGKRKCRTHDSGTCDQRAPGFCEAGNPTLTVCNGKGHCACYRTTGGSRACADANLSECAECQKDADCLALGFPTGASCVPIGGEYVCDGLCEGGTACLVPCGYEPPIP